jgi:carboxyl-terminal processing protease
MIRYTVQLFGVTVFALALIWFAAPGDAVQNTETPQGTLWSKTWAASGDTVHINVDEQQPLEQPQDNRDTFLRNVKKLHQTAYFIKNQYMEEIDSDELIKDGIRGMLSDLDRFSVLMEKSAYDNLMEATHGKYSGLGMQIDSRDDRIVIIAPIEGTPAYRRGLRSGDVIWEIDGESTYKMSSSDAAGIMRGEAGTSVRLKIKRAGLPEPLEFEIERAVITLKSVNYYGIIPGTDIGYIRLSRFAEETSHELREAVSSLNEQNISGLVFDLRSNGGGLLDQAKEVSELFLEEGREIVYTRGRFAESERHYFAERPPLYPDKALVVLVDQGTASASEIVAGAVQDWDRGLILGTATYGKGLVQQIFPIASDGSIALKLTTAKYYVPSGRCIQKAETQTKGTPPHAEQSDDDEAVDSLEVSDEDIFYTNGGRIVYGGGGIVPDIEIESDTWKPIEINFERQSMFFDFAVKYVSGHPDLSPDFEVTDEILTEFRSFLKERDFSYKSTLQVALEEMEETVNDAERDVSFDEPIENMRAMVEQEKDRDFTRSRDYITRAIKREIVRSIAGERGVYEQIYLHDKTVNRAVEILQEPAEYGRLLTEGKKKAEL